MIEPIMYFGIGFLIAALIGLVIVPLVHNRAVRLTMRRLEAATPLSLAEIQADKDQLRAEFAMSTRRLELSVEQLKSKSTSQLAELGKKSDAINRLKMELGEKTATIFALEARDKALRDQLRATEEEFAVKTSTMLEAQRALSEKEAELARVTSLLTEHSQTEDTKRAEIDGLRAQVDTLKERLSHADSELKIVEVRRDAERVELKAATQELAEERGKVENLGRRVAELEEALVVQRTEAEMLSRRAHDLETRLTEQTKVLAESEIELKRLRSEYEAAQKTEANLRSAIAELEGRASTANQRLKGENAQLQSELSHTKEDRERIAAELAALKRYAEQNWETERVENALLRERINDVAAEVARLASSLEGPNSSIEAMLAAESSRESAGSIAPVTVNGDVEMQAEGPGNLADRIRALQSRGGARTQGDPQVN
jgi:chromosome segregation ATPase